MSNTVLSSALPLTSIIATATQLGIENATTFQLENLFDSIDAALIYLTLIRFLDYNDFRPVECKPSLEQGGSSAAGHRHPAT